MDFRPNSGGLRFSGRALSCRFLSVSWFRIDKTGRLRKLRSVSSLSLTPASYRWDEWKAWLSPLAAAVLSWYCLQAVSSQGVLPVTSLHSLKRSVRFSFEERDVNPTAPEFSAACAGTTDTPASLLICAGNLEQEGHFQAALAAFRAASLCPDFIEGKLAFASFLSRREEHSAAEILLKEAQQQIHDAPGEGDAQLEEGGRALTLSSVLHNQAVATRSRGDFATATTLQQQSMKLQLDETGEVTPEDLSGSAADAIYRGEFDLAENLLLRSLHEETDSGNQAGIAADCGNLGLLAGLRGNLAVGIRFLGRAVRLHRELGDDLGSGTDYLNLAELFRTAGRWSLAARCLRRAKKHFRKAGAPSSMKKAEARLAELSDLKMLDDVTARAPLLN